MSLARRATLLLFGAAALLAACQKTASRDREITIAAAASLRMALPELIERYEAAHPEVHVQASYGASGDLEKQVEGGAPIDAVMFAAPGPVDALIAKGRVDAPSRRVIASNQIVLIGPSAGGPDLTFANLDTIARDRMIAIGDPGAVPAGRYAREYLEAIGKWQALSGSVVLGGDVSAVLAYARRGEVAAAIVYRTEVRGVPGIRVLDEARGPKAPRPLVVAGVVTGGKRAGDAAAFLSFASSPEGRAVLEGFGFGPP